LVQRPPPLACVTGLGRWAVLSEGLFLGPTPGNATCSTVATCWKGVLLPDIWSTHEHMMHGSSCCGLLVVASCLPSPHSCCPRTEHTACCNCTQLRCLELLRCASGAAVAGQPPLDAVKDEPASGRPTTIHNIDCTRTVPGGQLTVWSTDAGKCQGTHDWGAYQCTASAVVSAQLLFWSNFMKWRALNVAMCCWGVIM
jgi:hypothetical protein